jgi:23S rRNA (uracil1939-C5)-methyltransferase
VNVPEELELSIDGLGSAGDGVGRLPDGRVVFVARALPGDRVVVRLTHLRKQVQHAELVRIVEPSADRVEPRCTAVDCGGCGLMELSGAARLVLARRRVLETLRRLGGLDVERLLGPVNREGDGWHWRHRVRLHASWGGDSWRLGYHARQSNTLVPLEACPVLWPELEAVALAVGRSLTGLPREARLEELELVYSRRDGRAAGRAIGSGPLEQYKHWLDAALDAGLAGIVAETGGKSFGLGNLELRYDHARASEFDLRFEAGVFTQANPALNDLLVETVLHAVRPAEGERLLELHAGIGNFSLPLRMTGVDVTAVEAQPRAAVLCRRNARGAGVELDVRTEDDATAVSDLAGFRAVLMDPPRTGAREAAEAIARASGVTRLVYVSCDVATLARDAAILAAGGFVVTAAHAFDMFPQTSHVETVLALGRP